MGLVKTALRTAANLPKITHEERLEALLQTALAAVSYVGYANYDHRERAAKFAVNKSASTGEYVDPDSCNTR